MWRESSAPQLLPGSFFPCSDNMRIIKLDSVGSTNTYLKQLAKGGIEPPCVVIAEEQSAGRGSNGRQFSSPKGGLYLSYFIRPAKSAEELVGITIPAAEAVRRAILAVCPGLVITLKPVNDLLINGKKLCGILTELSGANLIIGVGINVNRVEFPGGLNATSLFLETGCEQSLDILAGNVIKELEAFSAQLL